MSKQEIDDFIREYRARVNVNYVIREATDKQKQKLAIVVRERLDDPKNKNRVLQAITGLSMYDPAKDKASSTTLGFSEHNVLIDMLEKEGNNGILKQIEDAIKGRVDAWNFSPLSNMRNANNGRG